MRRGAAWIVVGAIILVLIFSAYTLQGVLRPTAGVTPTPTKTPRLAMGTEPDQGGVSGTDSTPVVQQAQGTPTDVSALSTPIPLEPIATPVPPAPTDTPATLPDTPTPESTPFAISSGDFNVNIRSGPGVDFPRIGKLPMGGSMAVVGKTANGEWWQVCCVDGQSGWVWADVVEVNGPLDNVPIPLDLPQGESPATAAPTSAAPAPTNPPPAPASTPIPAFAFALEEITEFDSSNNVVTVFARIYQPGSPPQPLSGYLMRVLKNGGEVAALNSNAVWYDTAPAGWSNAMKYNVDKFEEPLDNATWTAYVIDGSGKQISTETTFRTSGDSPKREFHIVFALK